MKRICYFIVSILTFSLVSCVDWQEEYNKKIAEAAEPIQDRFEFLEEMHHKMNVEGKCAIHDQDDNLSVDEVVLISKYNPKEIVAQVSNPEEWIVFHTPDSLGYHMGDDGFLIKDKYNSYYRFVTDTVTSKDQLESKLRWFNEDVVEPIKTAKYLLVVSDEILIKPEVKYKEKYGFKSREYEGFTGGYVLANVIVYGLSSKQQIDSYKVAAKNSEALECEDYALRSELDRDLLENLKKSVLSEAERRIKNR